MTYNDYWYKLQGRFEFEKDPGNDMVVGPDGAHYQSEAAAMYYSLELCGCGSPEAVHRFLHECLGQFDRDQVGPDATDLIGVDGIQRVVERDPQVAAEFIAHFLDSHHLTEHGGSVYGSWLTDRGRQFLEVGPMPEED